MSDPQIPVALAPVVKGIASLSDFKPQPMHELVPNIHLPVPDYPDLCGHAAGQCGNLQLKSALRCRNSRDRARRSAMVEDTDTYGTAGSWRCDWNTYRSTFGLSG